MNGRQSVSNARSYCRAVGAAGPLDGPCWSGGSSHRNSKRARSDLERTAFANPGSGLTTTTSSSTSSMQCSPSSAIYALANQRRSQSLQLVASIKSSQITSNLDLLETTSKTIITRILIQSALQRYYAGNTTEENFASSITDVQSALGSRGYLSLYQASIYARDVENGETLARRLLNVTSDEVPEIRLPYDHPNGTAVMLGDEGLGYPPSLYPNLTEDATTNKLYAFDGVPITTNQPLLLGPLATNDSFSLISLSLPIINNTSAADILGYITYDAASSRLTLLTLQCRCERRESAGCDELSARAWKLRSSPPACPF